MIPFRIQHIDHIVLRVSDVERSVHFYQQVLGCELAKRREYMGLIHLQAGTSMIDLVDVRGPLGREGGEAAGKDRRNVDHFCLRVDPFNEEEILKHLASHNIFPEKAAMRFGAEGSGLSLYCNDPDGNQVELKGPAQVC